MITSTSQESQKVVKFHVTFQVPLSTVHKRPDFNLASTHVQYSHNICVTTGTRY